MNTLHIIHGGIENGDFEKISREATKSKKVNNWVVPLNSKIGDPVVIYFSGYGFYAKAKIDSLPKKRTDWHNRYGSKLKDIELIWPSITLPEIKSRIPDLKWANYPKSLTTPSPPNAKKINSLIKKRMKNGLLDLNENNIDNLNIEVLRDLAIFKSKGSLTAKSRQVEYRYRSIAIHKYVLARSEGFCESCNNPAPFLKKNSDPYLEPHHITRIADDGPDHPNMVIALCPNCHRKAHYSSEAEKFNSNLLIIVKRKEDLVS